jgi:hypothetical protein
VATEIATQTTARASRPPSRAPTADQSVWAAKASRPACTAQLSGLHWAMACIQPGISVAGRNAEDRKVSGSMKNTLMPMMASRWRTSMPTVLDSAPNTFPIRIEATATMTAPSRPPG